MSLIELTDFGSPKKEYVNPDHITNVMPSPCNINCGRGSKIITVNGVETMVYESPEEVYRLVKAAKRRKK